MSQPKKILVVRFSSIGDIVLTTPVVRGLKQQLDAEVHYLTKNAFRFIVTPNPYIDKVYSIDKRITEVLSELKAERYDLVVDLHNNLRTTRLWLKLRVPTRSFHKLNLQKWLLVQLKIDRLPEVHIVDRYLDTVRHLGVKNDEKGLDYFIPERDEVDIDDYFSQHLPSQAKKVDAIAAPIPYLAFVIGAAHNTKRLPAEKIIAICRQSPWPVVLLGGPEEKEEGGRIAEVSGPHVISACGNMRLHQSASMVRQAAKVITHDTGLMHIAAAFGKPIFSIWGNTVPKFGMYPYYPKGTDRNTSFEVDGLPCRPCSKIGYDECPKGHFKCMQMIDENRIAALL